MTCENCIHLINKESCYIYGTPNHDVSICKDWIYKGDQNK